jgi:3-phosphoshikimate 1-carboxyvinyltransferase
MKKIPKIDRVAGRVAVPPSKSYTARALLLASMTAGDTTVRNPLDSDDSRYMLEAIRKMGFAVRGSFPDGITIGDRLSMSAEEVELFIGNAGTAMRFLTGYLAFTPGRFLLTGESRMMQRPIGDLVEALVAIGAEIEYAGVEGFPPLRIRGKRVRGGFEVPISGAVSSQFVSSLMMAGATLPSGVDLRIESLASKPYVDMTADILRTFGGSIDVRGNVMTVPGRRLELNEYVVESDWSSASYWIAAAAAIGGELTLTGLRRDSAQGDRQLLDVLASMGADAAWSDGDLTVRGGDLRGGTFDFNSMPDVALTLAAIAPFASGDVTITNVANLRVKESDRIATTAEALRFLGAAVETGEDFLRIHPGFSTSDATIATHDDHRIAMSFAITGLKRGGVTIADPQVVSKSYPRFWRTLDEVVASSTGASTRP